MSCGHADTFGIVCTLTEWFIKGKFEFEFEWGVYAQSASEAIFRVGAYSHNYSVCKDDYLMNETIGGTRPPGDNPLLFSISGNS